MSSDDLINPLTTQKQVETESKHQLRDAIALAPSSQASENQTEHHSESERDEDGSGSVDASPLSETQQDEHGLVPASVSSSTPEQTNTTPEDDPHIANSKPADHAAVVLAHLKESGYADSSKRMRHVTLFSKDDEEANQWIHGHQEKWFAGILIHDKKILVLRGQVCII